MNYKTLFKKTIENAKTPLLGCVEVFNNVANSRYFEHMEIVEEDGHLFMGEEREEITSVNQICKELSYWLCCYYESGNVRHDEEFSDRIMLIRALEVLKNYCDESFDSYWMSYIPNNKDTKNLFHSCKFEIFTPF